MFSKGLETVTSKLESERKNHEKAMNDYVKEQNEKYNSLMKKKIDIEEELNMKKGKIQELERLCAELKRQIEEEIKKQKMSAESLLEDLVTFNLFRGKSQKEK